jgi:hypothetical protein
MNLRPGSLAKFLVCHSPQLTVLGFLADDRVLHDGVAEVINDRRDGENAAQAHTEFFQAWFSQPWFAGPARTPYQPKPLGLRSAPALRLRFVSL